MPNPITDYKLFREEDGRVLTAMVVIENSLRIDIKKPELWNMIITLENIFNNMDLETDPPDTL